MLRSAELNTFSMTNIIYRDLVCRANGGIDRLSGKMPWLYDGNASCVSKQTVTLLYWHIYFGLFICLVLYSSHKVLELTIRTFIV